MTDAATLEERFHPRPARARVGTGPRITISRLGVVRWRSACSRLSSWLLVARVRTPHPIACRLTIPSRCGGAPCGLVRQGFIRSARTRALDYSARALQI